MYRKRFYLLSILLWCVACAGGGGGGSSNGSVSGPTVAFVSEAIGRVVIDVEFAITPQERRRGLMFRNSLAESSGMLFLFEQQDVYSFTLLNTFIPLDLIFIDTNQRIVGIVSDAQPETAGPYAVSVASQYVLEVNGGFAERNGLAEGDLALFDNFNPSQLLADF